MFILEFLVTVLYILLILAVVLVALALAIPIGILYLIYRLIFRRRKKVVRKTKKVKNKDIAQDVMSIVNKSLSGKDVDKDELKKEINELVHKTKGTDSVEE